MKLTRRDFLLRALAWSGGLLVPMQAAGTLSQRVEDRQPAYRELAATGELAHRVEMAGAVFRECVLCPRQCGVDRSRGERGFCRAPARVMVYSVHPHFGEEVSLVGRGGSGTIFFPNAPVSRGLQGL